MKSDTFAKLVVLEALIDAEVGQWLESRPAPHDQLREELVALLSDRIDEIDALDAVAAARVYDAIVDFLAELPDEQSDLIGATLRFKRAMDRVVARGMERRDYQQPSTWAVVLDEVLRALALEYRRAFGADGTLRRAEQLRALALLDRANHVADRLLWTSGSARRTELREHLDRLNFAIRHQGLTPDEVNRLLLPAQQRVQQHRPSTLTRIGTFVLGQLLRRSQRSGSAPEPRRQPRAGGDQGHPAAA